MARFQALIDGFLLLIDGSLRLVDGFSALMRTLLARPSHMSMRYSLMATLQRIDK
jgi:hypothetical protein